MTIHLVVGYVVRLNGNTFLVFKTFGGSVIYKKPIRGEAVAQQEERKVVLAKPILRRRKPQGVA